MENDDDTQQAILIELRLIRGAVRGILFILACGIIFAVVTALFPGLGGAVALLAGIIAVTAVVMVALGIGAAKAINKIKDK